MKFKNSTLFESLIAVLPITALILLINFCLPQRLNGYDLLGFIFGNLLLIAGMALYSKGTKISLAPIGDAFGSFVTSKKKIWIFLLTGFLLGFIITVAEPDLSVLGEQLGSIKWILIITIALGVGLFLALSLLKTLLKFDFTLMIMITYAVVFIVSLFVAPKYIPLSFDSGGVTTGALTVPFILALGASVSGMLGGKSKSENSFGMIAICSVGPIIMTLLLCLIFKPSVDISIEHKTSQSLLELLILYGQSALVYFKEVFIALAPITLLFFICNFIWFKLPLIQIKRISVGLAYTYVGLSIFLAGVNAAYMGTGFFIGQNLALTSMQWILIPVGAAVGLLIVLAEPAVGVLVKQVEDISSGTIKKRTIKIALALSMALALALSMWRILSGISIWLIIGPGYAIALGLSFFVPRVYTSIAFDSGGVASGPMTATFLLPFAIGATQVIQGTDGVLYYAYGLVATVALMPLITVQLMGLTAKIKDNNRAKRKNALIAKIKEEDIIELDY